MCGECTGAFLYARYSLLLVSNKFVMGGAEQYFTTLEGWGSSAVK